MVFPPLSIYESRIHNIVFPMEDIPRVESMNSLG